ncbi:MAG TPA: methyltransferase domain-containing protein [Nannocystaceae bacterium]|nr:methyltransferase domain-containing protein [Nannocystaceae bacterium]
MTTERAYLPAAGHDWALPLYDAFTRVLGAGREREALIERAEIRSGQRVLDLGCGTGTLVVELGRGQQGVDVVGVDPDAKALLLAHRKAARAGAVVSLDRGFADALPYPDASFDRVLSSFMFHHIPEAQRETSLREVARVLKPGGRVHLLDFAASDPQGPWQVFRMFHRALHGNTEPEMLRLLARAGLVDASVEYRRANRLFTAVSWRATAPRRVA